MRLRLPRLPHPLVLLLGGVSVAVLTCVIPAGFYERRTDPVTQRSVVIPGTYARAKAAPVSPAVRSWPCRAGSSPVQARVGYDRWLRFAVPGALLVALVGAAGIVLVR